MVIGTIWEGWNELFLRYPENLSQSMFIPECSCPERFSKNLMTIAHEEMPDILSKDMIREAGGNPIPSTASILLGSNTFLLSGEVPRKTQWETGFKGHLAFVDDDWGDDQEIIDNQYLIVNVKGKGLVVISGCSHAGFVNITNYSLELTGKKKVEAVIGGRHLIGAKD